MNPHFFATESDIAIRYVNFWVNAAWLALERIVAAIVGILIAAVSWLGFPSPTAVNLGLFCPEVQAVRHATGPRINRHHCPTIRRMLTFVLENKSYYPVAGLREKPVRGLADDAPSYSKVGAPSNTAAVRATR